MVNLTSADISDSAGVQEIVSAIRTRWPWLKHLFGNAAYDRTKLLDAAAYRDFSGDHPPLGRRFGLQGASPAPGGRAYLRVDDALAQAGTRL